MDFMCRLIEVLSLRKTLNNHGIAAVKSNKSYNITHFRMLYYLSATGRSPCFRKVESSRLFGGGEMYRMGDMDVKAITYHSKQDYNHMKWRRAFLFPFSRTTSDVSIE
jgi:hypothetical protein